MSKKLREDNTNPSFFLTQDWDLSTQNTPLICAATHVRMDNGFIIGNLATSFHTSKKLRLIVTLPVWGIMAMQSDITQNRRLLLHLSQAVQTLIPHSTLLWFPGSCPGLLSASPGHWQIRQDTQVPSEMYLNASLHSSSFNSLTAPAYWRSTISVATMKTQKIYFTVYSSVQCISAHLATS